MDIGHTEKSIKELNNKGLALIIILTIPLLVVSIYFIWLNQFTIIWNAIPWGALLIFLWIMWSYIWNERTKFEKYKSKLKRSPSDYIYELFGYPGFTFIVAMVFSFIISILSIVFIIIGFWQIYYAKKMIDFNLLPVLQKKRKIKQLKSTA